MQQRRAAQLGCLPGREPAAPGRGAHELRDAARMTRGIRGLQVRQIGDRLQCLLQLLFGHHRPQRRLRIDQLIPAGGGLEPGQHQPGLQAQEIHKRGIELRAAAAAGDPGRRVDPALPPMALRHPGELHDPGRQRDLFTPQPVRASLPIPPLEHMMKRVPHAGTQAQPDGDLSGQLAVGALERARDLPVRGDQRRQQPRPAQRRTARAHMAQHEARRRPPGHIDLVAIGLHRYLVPEPRRLLVRLRVTADPAQQGNVVDNRPLVLGQPSALGQAQPQPARTQQMLHRLPQAKIARQRHRGDQLRQPQSRTISTITRSAAWSWRIRMLG